MVVHQGGQRQVIEKIREKLPNVGISVLAQTLVVESIHLSDLPRFVVTTQDCYAIAVSQFEGDEQSHGLNRVVTTVDVITHEEVVGVGRVAANAEEFREVVLQSTASIF